MQDGCMGNIEMWTYRIGLFLKHIGYQLQCPWRYRGTEVEVSQRSQVGFTYILLLILLLLTPCTLRKSRIARWQ